MNKDPGIRTTLAAAALELGVAGAPAGARTAKPVLHGQHWVAITGVREELERMGYTLDFEERTSGPINAVWFDVPHGTFWGGSSNHGDGYGIAW